MATSQNGWSVLFEAPAGVLRWITGRTRAGDVKVVLGYLCSRLNQIEKNVPAWSWGWAVRAIRGQTSGYSNHASATAIDYNAPAHPLSVTNTWSTIEKQRVHKILSDMNDVIGWGEDYSGRKDGMHFELIKGRLAVKRLAWKIRNGRMPDQKPTWEPRDAVAINFGRVQEQFLIVAGLQKGEVVKLNGVGLIQEALNLVLAGSDLTVDGLVGVGTLNAWGRWDDRVDGTGRRRIPDRKSVEALAKKAGLEINDKTFD